MANVKSQKMRCSDRARIIEKLTKLCQQPTVEE